MRWVLAVAMFLCASSAFADDVAKRPVPDYDGRGDEPTTAGDVLIWVPRVAVSPLYLVSEYVVRRPMGAFVVVAERERWAEHVMDYVNGPIGIIPTGLIDLGLHPTAGFYFWWNDAVAANNQIRASASFGADAITATLVDRVNIPDSGWQIWVRGALSRRGDPKFYGVGPGTPFRRRGPLRGPPDRGQRRSFVPFRRPEPPPLRCRDAQGRLRRRPLLRRPLHPRGRGHGLFPLPPGWAEGGYRGPFTRLQLVLDSRPEAPATGVALAIEGEQGSDTRTDRVWLRASATLSGSLEIGKPHRVASLILHAAMAEPLEGDDVPFTELASLGGSGSLPGFLAGRVIGRSAVAATLQYEWPIWAYMTGVFQVGSGEAFGNHFEGLELGRMRGSVGMGIRSVGVGDHRFELLVALGTRPFDDGASIDSVRFVIGGVIGF